MAITKPQVLPPWAESGDTVQPTNAEIQVGWPAGATPPSRQRFNWVLRYCMNGVRYLMRRGLADWDADETYAIGDRVIGPTGSTYQALTANTNKTPASNPTDWALWGFGPGDLATLETDNSSKLASTSWIRSAMSNIASAAGFASLLAANGYIVLPSWLGGVIIQWGTVSALQNATATGTYPIAFPNAAFHISASGSVNAIGSDSQRGMAFPVVDRFGFTIANDGLADTSIRYIVIGH